MDVKKNLLLYPPPLEGLRVREKYLFWWKFPYRGLKSWPFHHGCSGECQTSNLNLSLTLVNIKLVCILFLCKTFNNIYLDFLKILDKLEANLQILSEFWVLFSKSYYFAFLAPTGAQEVTLCVCLSVHPWYLWILHLIFTILAQVIKQSLSGLSAVSQQSLCSISEVSLLASNCRSLKILRLVSILFKTLHMALLSK